MGVHALRHGPDDGEMARLVHERAVLSRAEASLQAGRGLPLAELEAWLAQFDHNADAPSPPSAR